MTFKVFLGDLMHTWTGGGVYTFPLNIGYVGSYLKKQLEKGKLPYRQFGKPIHVPSGKEKVSQIPKEWKLLCGGRSNAHKSSCCT